MVEIGGLMVAMANYHGNSQFESKIERKKKEKFCGLPNNQDHSQAFTWIDFFAPYYIQFLHPIVAFLPPDATPTSRFSLSFLSMATALIVHFFVLARRHKLQGNNKDRSTLGSV